ncbi:hypothetical protein [Methanocaldococcus fervens]|nr:hypothetical protein [Methanocaldococcus fervens]
MKVTIKWLRAPAPHQHHPGKCLRVMPHLAFSAPNVELITYAIFLVLSFI